MAGPADPGGPDRRGKRMGCELRALCVDAHDPAALARFWAGLLGWAVSAPLSDRPAVAELVPTDDTGFRLRFVASDAPKIGQNHLHLDLTSRSLDDQQQTVSTALRLGATHLDIGQRPEEGHVVLADPEGNEFCVIGPGNQFLADCGFVGAVAGDGSRRAGLFWSAALGWPLVWDQGEETGIRAPSGGPKITWGGPPLLAKLGKSRLHFDLATAAGGDQPAEVQRLIELGATRVDIGQGPVSWVVLADPDGREFCLLPPS
jgi:predicted enzyme related to lactoylglutathione lyase